MKKYMFALLLLGLAILIVAVASEEASATKTPTSIDVIVNNNIENTTASAEVQLEWTGRGGWDSPDVTVEWFRGSNLEFTELIQPDGNGYLFSNHVPDWGGTWYVNASWNALYDNVSFEVEAETVETIDNVVWSEEINVNVTFIENWTWIGQEQGITIEVYNATDYTPIVGVNAHVAIILSTGETVLPALELEPSSNNGFMYDTFSIPVNKEYEDTYFKVVISVTSIDYTGNYGWLHTSQHDFYCGYFFAFDNDDNHTVDSEYYNVFDDVWAFIDYDTNYTDAFILSYEYKITNASNGVIYGTGSEEYPITGVVIPAVPFNLPLGLQPGGTYVEAIISIHIPNTDKTIEIVRRTETFTINDTTALVLNELPFKVYEHDGNLSSLNVGDDFHVVTNITTHAIFEMKIVMGLVNLDTNVEYEPDKIFRDIVSVGTYELSAIYIIKNEVDSGNHYVRGTISYTINGITDVIFYESEQFIIEALSARASSDIAVFNNQTRIEMDGSDSHGYNDSYYGLRWTSSHDPSTIYYGLDPIMIINETGTFTITLNITDGNGNYSEDFFVVHSFDPLVNNIYTNATTTNNTSTSTTTTDILPIYIPDDNETRGEDGLEEESTPPNSLMYISIIAIFGGIAVLYLMSKGKKKSEISPLPPMSAHDKCGIESLGTDGNMWKSQKNSSGVCTWQRK